MILGWKETFIETKEKKPLVADFTKSVTYAYN